MSASPSSSFSPATPDHATRMPVFIEHAQLKVRDLPVVSAWYQRMLGLSAIETSASGHTLGVDGVPLLTLTTATDVAAGAPRAPGLFHNAFLVPDRAALGRWLAHAAHEGVVLQGASDHLVSEAIYLADPEGNGIEVYRDRPRMAWSYQEDGKVGMATLPLDLQALYDEAPKGGFAGMAPGTRLGHLHLQVTALPEADQFFREILGLDLMTTYPGAHFYASGQYHHHVAANIWNSRGVARRDEKAAGLTDYAIRFNDPARLTQALATLDRLELPVERGSDWARLTDPWGMRLTVSA
ncbi:glyoxalase [Xaviernesmea oryzae]|uniref:Glyoxalase n=1 Tax=Xaviernesmea oryzae TaxID=464029 RepID=A0A1Q9B1F7_9HYPH|nr:VOC family protein [Xaviernesmea oryzae]OLP61842.1 glyoxalase [Xaviernesmea oryzae]SEL75786.1 catechol 2,3-dioxygenase [Xaviernesmea oryzae]